MVQQLCADPNPHKYNISGQEGMIFHWNLPDGGSFKNSDTLNDTVWINWPQNKGDFRLSVYGDLFGCISDMKTITVHINKDPVVNLGSDISLCEGQDTIIQLNQSYPSVIWNGKTSGPSYTVDSPQLVWVKVTDSIGCSGTDSMNIFYNPKPVVNLGKDTSLCGDNNFLVLNAGNPGSSYEWSTGSITPTISVGDTEHYYWVKVTNAFDCLAIDTIHVEKCNIVFSKDKIPTVFTPNGDGVNETWEIPGLSEYPRATIDIYDRWGRIVYHSKSGYPEPWDGRNNNHTLLPMDTYFYIINLNANNKPAVVGAITIIR